MAEAGGKGRAGWEKGGDCPSVFINQELFNDAAEILTSLIAYMNRQTNRGCVISFVQEKTPFIFNRLILTVARQVARI